jgi:hypothetical protein
MATQGPLHEPEIVDPMIDPRTGEYAVIAPGHTFKSVTQKIAGIVLTANTPWAWIGGLFLAATIATGVVIAVTWLVLKGVGICLVDRYRPRGHADLGDPAALQAAVAQLDQPLR